MFAHLNNYIRALAVLTSVEKTAPSKADNTQTAQHFKTLFFFYLMILFCEV